MEKLTPEQQRENRLKLADYLEHEVSADEFDMGQWVAPKTSDNYCGTVGCALGHAVIGKIIPGLTSTRSRSGIILKPAICSAEEGVPPQESSWAAAGRMFFGDDAYERVFTNATYTTTFRGSPSVKAAVIAHLREL